MASRKADLEDMVLFYLLRHHNEKEFTFYPDPEDVDDYQHLFASRGTSILHNYNTGQMRVFTADSLRKTLTKEELPRSTKQNVLPPTGMEESREDTRQDILDHAGIEDLRPRAKKRTVLATAGIVALVCAEIGAIALAIYMSVGPFTILFGLLAAFLLGHAIAGKENRRTGLLLAVVALVIAVAAYFAEDSYRSSGTWRIRRWGR